MNTKRTKIPVKYVQPIESLLINHEDGTQIHWSNSKLVPYKPVETNIEWIDGKPCRVTTA